MTDTRVGSWTFGALRKAPVPTGEGVELVVEGGDQVQHRKAAGTGVTLPLIGTDIGDSMAARWCRALLTCNECGPIATPVFCVLVAIIVIFSLLISSGWDLDWSDDSNSTNSTR